MALENTVFNRRFCVNPYKTLRLPLGELSCEKDWVNTKRGDTYPVKEKTNVLESVEGGAYFVKNDTNESGRVTRILGSHFPISTYELKLNELTGKAGFTLTAGALTFTALVSYNKDKYNIEVLTDKGALASFEHIAPFVPGSRFLLTMIYEKAELYIAEGEHIGFVGACEYKDFSIIDRTKVYENATSVLTVALEKGESAYLNCEFYLDGGVSQADFRAVTYEDGTPVIENGRAFLTCSARYIDSGYQMVISWKPGLNDFRLEGALFYDPGDGRMCGDDRMCGDVAATLVYDRNKSEWLLWACSFSHGHILCHTRMKADPRFGINVLDVTLMPAENSELTLSDDRLFLAKRGDEDPALVYDKARGKWIFSICRVIATRNGNSEYRYYVYEGNDPFEGFTYIGNTTEGAGTGGSFIELDGERYLLSGANFDKRANYYLYPLGALDTHTMLSFDYDDGGFRGWGTLIQVPAGTRTRKYLLTFDRHNGGTGNWTYGNVYVFEGVEKR